MSGCVPAAPSQVAEGGYDVKPLRDLVAGQSSFEGLAKGINQVLRGIRREDHIGGHRLAPDRIGLAPDEHLARNYSPLSS
jgi:hypothetical protein